ncbi:MAG: TlpA family protein disulfide reductase [Bacteroidetes bacterium]|nr:MAG: TlpA family protein disulfide reductase [Bacteroidota bacterium]
MFQKALFAVLGLTFSVSCFLGQTNIKVKEGIWAAGLVLNDTTTLPFKLQVANSQKSLVFTIHNAEEQIQLTRFRAIGDSFQIDFPHFHSFLRFKRINKKKISGYWQNLNKGTNYRIPFCANYVKKPVKNDVSNLALSGKWKVVFDPRSGNPDLAQGVFNSSSEGLEGTFLTETGDFRFLSGRTDQQHFFLSCFDGSHAFYFSGDVSGEQISNGHFYSGKHYHTDWIAHKDDAFSLRDPDSITYLKENSAFRFSFKQTDGNTFDFPNKAFHDKVTIVQIMGTWCPNCLDEIMYFKDIYKKYHSQGLEIISIAYETPESFEKQVEIIELYKKRLNLNHLFLVGGQASKSKSSEDFSMLNEIISYPTVIFIDRGGDVVRIHTGFNGPGTGKVYQDYAEETERFIQKLLKDRP